MSKIEVKKVSKVFGAYPKSIVPLLNGDLSKSDIQAQHNHVVGLRNVSLDMAEGKVHVIMGLSGSGKSTLIRHFNRLIDPTSGAIIIDGQDILSLSPRELQHLRQTKISMVFQNFGLMPHRTVLDNVAYGLEVRGDARNAREDSVRKWISKVGLQGYEGSYPHELSGGMQQRVGLARGLATNPDILLMDEAFSALDPLIRSDMQTVLLDLQRELNKTIIFITHDLDEALAIGDRIAILQDGELVQVGSPQEIILQPANDYIQRFVANVNRGRALRVAAIMKTPNGAVPHASDLRRSDTLELALSKVVGAKGPVSVLDDATHELCGTVTAQQIVAAISGQLGGKP
ncbi:glycine betaine/L-proline ABC transporter ATP-binding protein [Pseudohalocynthiibacter aestuariivivens]|uniref:Quaternary amine transport ATP-binding protein n=1 Tax=Roseovarius pelagicus TaxID=2980108 RepID=A0ABY6DF73_9RHOB|nr:MULTISPECIES: glycine betaine/L-proline ABC transporter ATP-binding protein [Rhodobacterales]QIE46694.1 glycine betaine/L-proline ABC transporter ATP-binding protein [Pseudohalocynthiibacter aestuariivivens]UXX84773.1 glycine betaine/L-proline ABC transporter ATP-binding protein [Roseovarius pelagicus]